ncbi:MAG: DUF5723 family protein [Cytophagaceae bacterium]
MKRYILTSVIGFLLSADFSARAQEFTLPHMHSIYQASYVNPTALPDFKTSIGLPGISSFRFGYTNTGFTPNQLLKRSGDELIISPNQFYAGLAKKNAIYLNAGVDLFHLRVKKKDMFFSFDVSENVDFRFSLPRHLISLGLYGNGNNLGDANLLDFSSLGMDVTHYRSYAFGFIKNKQEGKFVYGGRLKFLQGMANASLRNKEMFLRTDEDMYGLDASVNSTLNLSSPISFDDDSWDDINFRNYISNFRNNGWGGDISASYRYTDKITFSGALTNIGFIRWRSNVENHIFSGAASFDGLDLLNEEEIEPLLDSLQSKFSYERTMNNYTTWLTPRLYLTANYKLTNTTRAGLTFYFDYYKRLWPGITASVSQGVGKWFETVFTWTTIYRSYDNIGFGLMVKPGPVQFYIVGENMFRTWTELEVEGSTVVIAPLNPKFITVRAGINLVFGRIRTQESLFVP